MEVYKKTAFCLYSDLGTIICWDTAFQIWKYLPMENESTILIKKLKDISCQCFPERIASEVFFQN